MTPRAHRTFQISSELRIAVDETGDLEGWPVFFFHGWPASRLQGAGFSVEARALGLRIIAPDRPGLGESGWQPHRRLLDWPTLVQEMARQMGLPRFSVLAVSGGGPYALATAFALPQQVEAVVIVSGAPPLGPAADHQKLLPVYRWLLALHRRAPLLLRAGFHLVRPLLSAPPPRWLWPAMLRLAPKLERTSLSGLGVLEGSIDCHREAWRGTPLGVWADGEIYARDWGFEPEEIQAPVRLWHGEQDGSFPWQLTEALGRRLPHAETRIIAGEGHYSLPIAHRLAILQDLLAARAEGVRRLGSSSGDQSLSSSRLS